MSDDRGRGCPDHRRPARREAAHGRRPRAHRPRAGPGRLLARRLRAEQVDLLVSSPLRRALETAAPIAAVTRLTPLPGDPAHTSCSSRTAGSPSTGCGRWSATPRWPGCCPAWREGVPAAGLTRLVAGPEAVRVTSAGDVSHLGQLRT
ncbi:MAG: histidine phosphatase family protein [Nocardioidaceae bacterium]